MKKYSIYMLMVLASCILISCKPTTTITKDVKYMGIKFKPLAKSDYTLVGNFEATSTITGKITPKGKTVDKKYAKDYRKGLSSKIEVSETMYFAPGKDEVITGSLYDNIFFNIITTPAGVATRPSFFQMLMNKKVALRSDPGVDFAYYALIEKYPNVDFFINVRFDRKLEVAKTKTFVETITVKADGIILKTDN